jgi:peptidyl-prolyl cis-trans isomerase SDCCAG10
MLYRIQVVGNTIYNVMRLNELEVDANERPLYPARILRTSVPDCPFDDIEPRQHAELRRAEKDQLDRQNAAKNKPKGKK